MLPIKKTNLNRRDFLKSTTTAAAITGLDGLPLSADIAGTGIGTINTQVAITTFQCFISAIHKTHDLLERLGDKSNIYLSHDDPKSRIYSDNDPMLTQILLQHGDLKRQEFVNGFSRLVSKDECKPVPPNIFVILARENLEQREAAANVVCEYQVQYRASTNFDNMLKDIDNTRFASIVNLYSSFDPQSVTEDDYRGGNYFARRMLRAFVALKEQGVAAIDRNILAHAMRKAMLPDTPAIPLQYRIDLKQLRQDRVVFNNAYTEFLKNTSEDNMTKLNELYTLKKELESLVNRAPHSLYKFTSGTRDPQRGLRIFQTEQEFNWYHKHFQVKLEKFKEELEQVSDRSQDYQKSLEYLFNEIQQIESTINHACRQYKSSLPADFIRCSPL